MLELLKCRGTILFFLLLLPVTALGGLPERLVLVLDGVSYRDMKALQEGIAYKDLHGRQFQRQAFHRGYFPVSRLVSTFPSTTDVACTEIFGDRPLPGYQRTYFCSAANAEIFHDGVTTSMEFERQMTWEVEDGFRRSLAYLFPGTAFKNEIQEMVDKFLETRSQEHNYYAYIRTTDDAQHRSGDIFAMLCALDDKLQELRARYKKREGRELEILILSDHGNNHAGAGKRVRIRSYLKKAGYRVTEAILGPKDVVLPTAGIENWVEVHNAPGETEKLAQLLSSMEGVEVLTARVPGSTNRFMVLNPAGERAEVEWNAVKNSFRYSAEAGDPLHYRPVIEALLQKRQLDSDGFAPAASWMAETLAHRYPLALERIVRTHTRVTLNPATVLISLDNQHVHSGWLVKKGSQLVTIGGTHGGLDDLCSDGILLSSFSPTPDTTTSRVAGLFDDFPGLRNYRAEESGAEWIRGEEQALTRIARTPLDRGPPGIPGDAVLLRIWTPNFARLSKDVPVEFTVASTRHDLPARNRRGDCALRASPEQTLILTSAISLPDNSPSERAYALPPELILAPHEAYRISGRIRDRKKIVRIFKFTFRTDSRGIPVAD